MPTKYQATLRSDGRYQVKQDGHTFYGRTAKEACRKRDAFFALPPEDRSDETVKEYAFRWLPVAKAAVSKRTYNEYAAILDRVNGVIGAKPISKVTPTDIKSVYALWIGKSESSIHHASVIINALFAAATADGLCRINPTLSPSAKPHKGESGSHRALTDEEIRLIRTTPHRAQLGAMVMLYAGLRRGEAMALRREDIDLASGTISVSRAIRYDSNQPIYAAPKTAAGVRSVPILAPLSAPLTAFVLSGDKLVISSASGSECTETAFTRLWDSYLLALSEAAGHPVFIRPHDLRHTYCTMLRDAGVDMKLAMLWMGHADEKMILRIYDHITENRTRAAINQLASIIK